MATTPKLSRVQERLISALLSESTIALAAAEAGISERTARNYLKDPGFQQAFQAARHELLTEVVGRMVKGSHQAVSALLRAVKSGKTQSEIAAARTLLEMTFRGSELLDLGTRLARVEEQLAALGVDNDEGTGGLGREANGPAAGRSSSNGRSP